jgi:two-component system, LytTR family, sensor kinase
MIRSSDKNAEKFVIKLSDIYRLLLTNKEIVTITLKEELEFIENYSFLLFVRYDDKISIKIEIPETYLNLKIPTFALQLLLENCVKHNIVSKEKPLYIRIYYSGEQMISIENNLQRKISTNNATGIGLQNLSKRYDLLNILNGVEIFCDESVYCVKIKLLDE